MAYRSRGFSPLTVGVKTIAIADSASNIIKSAASLKTIATTNKIDRILINDKTPPTLSVADILKINDIGVQNCQTIDGVNYNLADTASMIIAHARLDILDIVKNANTIKLTDTKTPVLTLADAQTLTSITKLDPKTKYSVADGGAAIATQAAISGEKVLSGAQAVTINKNYTIAQAKSVLALKNLDKNNAYAITDTVANILAESKVSGSKVLTGATAVNVSDTDFNLSDNADELEILARSGRITDVISTDNNSGNNDVSQFWLDADLFGKYIKPNAAEIGLQSFKISTNGISNYGVLVPGRAYGSLYQPWFKVPNGLSSVWVGNYDGFYDLKNDPRHMQIGLEFGNANISQSDGEVLLKQFMSAKTPQEFNVAMQIATSKGITPTLKCCLDNPSDVYGNGTLVKNGYIPVIYNAPSSTDTAINFSLRPTNWLDVSLSQSFYNLPKGSTNGWGPLSNYGQYTITGNEVGNLFVSVNSNNGTNFNADVTKYLAGFSSAKTPQEFDAAYKNAQSNAANNNPPFSLSIYFNIPQDNQDSGFSLAYGGLSPDGKNILLKSTLTP